MSHTARTTRTGVTMAICLILAGAIPASVVALVLGWNVDTNSALIENNRHTNEVVIDAIRKQCKNDHALREQYRQRAEIERDILEHLIESSTLTDEDVRVFERDRTKIRILPLPQCDEQAADLAADL